MAEAGLDEGIQRKSTPRKMDIQARHPRGDGEVGRRQPERGQVPAHRRRRLPEDCQPSARPSVLRTNPLVPPARA